MCLRFSFVKALTEINKVRPGSYVAFLPCRQCRMQFKQKDNEANHLIIYCLNCIRHRRNAKYEPGLNDFRVPRDS